MVCELMTVNEMADRIDALESSIQELVHGSDAKPSPPSESLAA